MPLHHLRAEIPAIFFWAVVLTGCATTTETVVTDLSSARNIQDPYLGLHKDKIIELWGKPTGIQPDGKGGSILVYDRREILEWEKKNAKDNATDPQDGHYFPVETGEKTTTVLSQEWIKFWTDSKGFVYQTWFHPDLWKDGGIPQPPPKEKPGKKPKKEESQHN